MHPSLQLFLCACVWTSIGLSNEEQVERLIDVGGGQLAEIFEVHGAALALQQDHARELLQRLVLVSGVEKIVAEEKKKKAMGGWAREGRRTVTVSG